LQNSILKLFFLITLIQLIGLTDSRAQEVPLEYYGIEEGLPELRIDHLSVLQDGRLLIGTTGRPTVYDGYQFNIIDKERRHWFINGCDDHEGTTWLTDIHGALFGYNGKRMFDHPAADSIVRLANTRKRHISLAFDTINTAYIGLDRGKHYVKAYQNGVVERIDINTEYLPNSAFIDGRHTRTPFFGSTYRTTENDSGFLYIDGKIVLKTARPLCDRAYYVRNDSLEVISVGKSLFFKRGKKIAHRYFGAGINKLFIDPYGKLWIAHTKGASFIDLQNPKHVHKVIDNLMCTSLILDKENHLWLGTTNGLYKVLSPFITNYYEGNGARLNATSPAEILYFKNKVTVVDKEGIFHFKGGKFDRIDAYQAPRSLSLATTGTNGFWTLRAQGPTFYGNDGSSFSKTMSGISGMASYSEDSTAWINQRGIISQLNEKCEVVKSFDIESLDWGEGMPERPLIKVVGMDHFNPCISIEMKLFIYKGDSLRRIYHESDDKKLKSINRVRNFRDLMLVGTKIDGLWILHSDTFYQLGTNNGLASDNVHTIVEENDSTLWLGTSKGLHRIAYSLKNKEFQYKITVINKTHGLPSSSISELLIHNDTLWLSTRGGISSISLNIFNRHKTILSQANIPWFQVNDLDSTYSMPLELKPTENQLTFGFKAVTFKPINQKKYAYRLLGENDNWRTTTDTMVSYSALPAGDFTFEVRTVGDDPDIISPTSQIAFSISKPFWRRTWFIIVAVLLAQLVAGLGVWLMNRSKRRRLSLEKNVLTAELKALRAQLNPHFMFNALGAIQGSIMEGSTEEALQNIGKLAHLMRKMLYATRNKRTTLKETLEVLKLYLELELVRQPDKFTYDIEYDQSCEDEMETINIPPSIIQPFVENAVLHGAAKANDKGIVKVKFEQFKDYIKCEISDNGPGYYKSQKQKKGQHRSLGLTIVKEQIDLLNMDLESKITLKIEEQMGTIVTVMMPVDF